MNPEVIVVPDEHALADRGAGLIATWLDGALATRGTASLALSGGTSPIPTHERLARQARDWKRVDVFEVDERCVPHGDPRCNWAMIERTLLDPATVPAGRRHPMPVETQQPPEAAYRAEAELLAVLGEPPRLDVCVLGIGPDGHTASLFPGAAQLASDRWIVDAPAGWEPYVHRVTMTFKTINEARACIFLVPDGSKADVVARALAADGDVSEAPARGVQPRDGELVWLLTAAAARGLAA